ncbi:hypothetical protein JHK85_001270 [Glycine max]|nr:hypothetical protein JHK85_001270 [Glycine max]
MPSPFLYPHALSPSNELRQPLSLPSSKMLVELSKSQDSAAGDSTTTVIVIIGALLKQCLHLLSHDIHPTIVTDALHKAAIKAVDVLIAMAVLVKLSNHEHQVSVHDRREEDLEEEEEEVGSPVTVNFVKNRVFAIGDFLNLNSIQCLPYNSHATWQKGQQKDPLTLARFGSDVNCGNTLLISLEGLVEDGLLEKHQLPQPIDAEWVNFSLIADLKDPLITKIASGLPLDFVQILIILRLIMSSGKIAMEGKVEHKFDMKPHGENIEEYGSSNEANA